MKTSVLVVDHDPREADRLGQMLASRGYEVRTATDTASALNSLQSHKPAIVITEMDEPQLDGLDLCRRIHQATEIPVIVVSTDRDPRIEVAALDSGADDFLVKPVYLDNLVARIRVALRRAGMAPEEAVVGVGPFNIDFHARRVHVNGQAVRLTPKEFDLFTFMAKHPNRVLPHKTLLGAVWGVTAGEQSEYLRVFVGQLRKKLEDDPSRPRYLVTEPWVGYRFNPSGLTQ